jgi:hypothetical protein
VSEAKLTESSSNARLEAARSSGSGSRIMSLTFSTVPVGGALQALSVPAEPPARERSSKEASSASLMTVGQRRKMIEAVSDHRAAAEGERERKGSRLGDGPLPSRASATIRSRNASPMTLPPRSWSDPASMMAPMPPSPKSAGRACRKPSMSSASSRGRSAVARSPVSVTAVERRTSSPKPNGLEASVWASRLAIVEGERARKGSIAREISS